MSKKTDDFWPLKEGDRLSYPIYPGWGEVVHLSDDAILIWWFTGVRTRFEREQFFKVGFVHQDGTPLIQDTTDLTSHQAEAALEGAQTSSIPQGVSETLDSSNKTHPNKSRKRYTGIRIELKYIRRNGKTYGPYEYLRFEVGGKSCSRYLGKAKVI